MASLKDCENGLIEQPFWSANKSEFREATCSIIEIIEDKDICRSISDQTVPSIELSMCNDFIFTRIL